MHYRRPRPELAGLGQSRHTVAATVGEAVNSFTGLVWPGHRTGGSSSALPTTCDTTAVATTTYLPIALADTIRWPTQLAGDFFPFNWNC